MSVALRSGHPGPFDSIKVKALVVNNIIADFPKRDVHAVKNDPSLEGLQLADPEFRAPGRINLLLGIVDYNVALRRGGQDIFLRDQKIVARKTLFEWPPGRKLPGLPSAIGSACLKMTVTDQHCDNLLEQLWS